MLRTGRSGRTIQALLIPAAPARPCQVIAVGYSASALSGAIGGGLLDDLYYGDLEEHADRSGQAGSAGHAGGSGRFCLYADLNRVAKRLPVNERAGILAARLGCIEELRPVPLAGDIVVTGATCTNDDTSVPGEVLSAARLAGLLPAPGPDSGHDQPATALPDLSPPAWEMRFR